jgi:hypothetical protein
MFTAALIAMIFGFALFALGLLLPFLAGRFERDEDASRTAPPPLPTYPSIEVVIAAYLESTVVGDTIRSLTAQLARRSGGSSITVVASDDETAAAALAAGAHVIRAEPRGKPAAINTGVLASTSDVIVLTDANCRLVPDTWADLLVASLSEADLVSAVKTEHGSREAAYWRYETAVKNSRYAGKETLSVIGEFLAFRREQFQPVPADTLVDDLYLAQDFALRGLSVRVAGGIHTSEPPTKGLEQIERRVRISAGHWEQAIVHWRQLTTVRAGRQFLAHKGYRMTVGAAGFWIAFVGFALLVPPITTAIACLALAASWLIYTRVESAPVLLRVGATVIVLQTVTFMGLWRAIRRSVSHHPQHGWKKVAR